MLKQISLAFCLLAAGLAAVTAGTGPADSRGMTTLPEAKAWQVVADESVAPGIGKQGGPAAPLRRFVPPVAKSAGWVLADSVLLSLQIAGRGKAVFCNNSLADTLEAVILPDTLTALARQAVQYAPDWIQPELTDNFGRLSAAFQDIYANLILSSPAQFADEIAYQVAKLGPATLSDWAFDPNLIVVNAQFLYQNDDSLDFADIIDYGSPPGGNYYSTVRYRAVENGDTLGGDTITYELPREYYYMYIVHPQTSDEAPQMGPAVYNRFWRDYLFNYADSGYPLLSEKLKGIKVLWHSKKYVLPPGRSFDSWDSALDIIGNWTSELLPVMAVGNRPIQPNTIAHEHNGNCGELQDLSGAAGRAALIPMVATMDYAEDHVWGEFYYKGWHEFQVDRGYGVTHIDDPTTSYDYDVGGNKDVSSIWNWRSDGYNWTVTGTDGYSNACSLHVTVCDARGLPVDGARVYLWTEAFSGSGYDVSVWGFTDAAGQCGFDLGESRNYYVSIRSQVANYPSDDANQIVKIVSYSQIGASYHKTFYLPLFSSFPRAVATDTTGSPVYQFEVELSSPFELLHGYVSARRDHLDTLPYNHTYNERRAPGLISFYLCDSLNYSRYLQGLQFQANVIAENVNSDTITFNAPYAGKWYCIFSNAFGVTASRRVEAKIKLSRQVKLAVNQEQPTLAATFRLNRSAPNPFTSNTAIEYSVGKQSAVRLQVYNLAGQRVRTLVDAVKPAGNYSVKWDGRDQSGKSLANGVYFYRLTAGEYAATKKLMLVQ